MKKNIKSKTIIMLFILAISVFFISTLKADMETCVKNLQECSSWCVSHSSDIPKCTHICAERLYRCLTK